jgi:hypothetical protein
MDSDEEVENTADCLTRLETDVYIAEIQQFITQYDKCLNLHAD